MRTTYSQAQILKIKEIADIIGNTSNVLIIYELMNFGEKSFNELKRMTDINAVTLSKKLTLLKSKGLVESHLMGRENRYFLTKKANNLQPLMDAISDLILDGIG